MDVSLTFWGVRGSLPTPVLENLGCGGNTSCLEIRAGNEILIFDAGTGIQKCGEKLFSNGSSKRRELSIFLSHFHWDHLQGLPFFGPIYRPDYCLRFAGGHPAEKTRATLQNLMHHPNFPVEWEQTAGNKQFVEIPAGGLALDGVTVESFPLNHPQGAFGYRILTDRGTIVYASDLEHGDPEHDAILREAAQGASLLIYDAQYTPEEYEGKRGWGHSTWVEAAKLAREADVERLVLFHHDPAHTDAAMRRIEQQAREMFPATDVAAEGMKFEL
jgi:phosphoribosyl 1,2-cyclic phosphodiesterase